VTRVSVFSDGSLQVTALPVEMRGKRAFLAHDFQCRNFTPWYLPRTWEYCQGLPEDKWVGAPETEKCGVANKEPLREPWQRLAFAMFVAYAPKVLREEPGLITLKEKWADFMHDKKFITNGFGSETCHDYINGTNEGREDMKQETLTTCGNIVILTGSKRNIGGKPFAGVLMLDRSFDPPDADTLLYHPAHKAFVHKATNSTVYKGSEGNFPRHAIAPKGTFKVDQFPHFEGNSAGVPFLFSTMLGEQSLFMGLHVRENWINEDRIILLDDDEYPSPYVR